MRTGYALTGLLAGVVQALLGPAGAVEAAVHGNGVVLAPHRAVYEISLDRSGSSSGIRELKGRMVYELAGSACEGYTQNMRFVTRTVGPKGRTSIADMRSSTWEEGLGRRFRFNSSQYQDDKLIERVSGEADRNRKGGARQVSIELSKPKQRRLRLSSKIYFPVQHSIALLQAANAGKPLLQADLYDGTDKGDKVYATTTIIGPLLPQTADGKLPRVKNTQNLRGMKVWPVSISYFRKKRKNIKEDTTPIYELAFRFYANGVSRRLFIDYGDFAVRGVLTKLTYYPASGCGAGGKTPAAKIGK